MSVDWHVRRSIVDGTNSINCLQRSKTNLNLHVFVLILQRSETRLVE
jgi:hypothetical protein